MKEGWIVKKLGEVCDIISGFSFRSSLFKTEGEPVLRISNIQNNEIVLEDMAYFTLSDYKCDLQGYKVFPNDIVIALSGATTGKIGVNKTGLTFYLNQRVALCREKNLHINIRKYLYYFLQTRTKEMLSLAGGAAQPNLSIKQIKNLFVPIPSLSEQHRIVSELDCLNGIIEKKREQLKELDALAQSIFYDMFGDPITNEKGWEIQALKDVAPQIAYQGEIPDKDNKYWLLNLDMVVPHTGDVIKKCYFEKEDIGDSVIKFDENNVLYSKLRPYLNKVVLPDNVGYATSELVPLFPRKDFLNRIYFAFLLRNKSFVSFISGKVAGAKMPRVSMETFRNFKVILPPLSLQQAFAEKISAIDKQKELIKQSLAEVENLFNSRMDYYFH